MADVTYTSLEGGDLFDAASLTSRFTGITAAVNDVEAAAVDRGAFNAAHLPSLIVDRQQTSFVGTGVGGNHVYDETEVLLPAYLTINRNGTNPPAGGNLEITFTAPVDLATAETGGIFIMCNLHVVNMDDDTPANVATRFITYRLQIRDGPGTWITVQRTERLLAESFASDQLFQVGVRTLIRSGDVVAGGGVGDVVQAVRAQISMQTAGAPPTRRVTLRECSLSGLVLHSSRATP